MRTVLTCCLATVEAKGRDKMLDLILAIAHHLAVFTLVAVFAAEFVLLRPGLEGRRVLQLGAIDGAYGGAAMLVIVVGILRVIFGGAGWEYYVGNWVFWAKMIAFVLMGLSSVPGTMAMARWRRAAKADAGFTPPADEIGKARRMLYVQAGLLAFIPAFAAAMARGYGG
jgi:putative membrane protein